MTPQTAALLEEYERERLACWVPVLADQPKPPKPPAPDDRYPRVRSGLSEDDLLCGYQGSTWRGRQW